MTIYMQKIEKKKYVNNNSSNNLFMLHDSSNIIDIMTTKRLLQFIVFSKQLKANTANKILCRCCVRFY